MNRRVRSRLQLALLGVATFALLVAGSVYASRRAGTTEAIHDARERTNLLARNVVEPALTTAVVDGEPAAQQEFIDGMRAVAANESYVHARIWSRDGHLVYADDVELIGRRFPLKDDALEAFESGEVSAEITDLTAAENALDDFEGELLEVYQPVRASDGRLLVFEAYYPIDLVGRSTRRIWLQFMPVVLIPLVVLQLLQLPLAARLARMVRRGEQERSYLLRQVVETTDRERRGMVQRLHDGVCQELSGTRLSLAALTRRLHDDLDPAAQEELKRASDEIGHSLDSLRSLLVEVYPPSPTAGGLTAALEELVGAFRTRGLAITVDNTSDGELGAPLAELVCRAVQEALRNAVDHAQASSVHVQVHDAGPDLVASVRDDGRGFDAAAVRRAPPAGHFGLRVIEDLAEEAGGRFEIDSVPGRGTTVRVAVPR